jgi:hypothetical protein
MGQQYRPFLFARIDDAHLRTSEDANPQTPFGTVSFAPSLEK